MTEAEKAVYDEEDPEIPADLFSLWAKTEHTLNDDEMAYLTSANDAAAPSGEQETVAESADDVAEAAEVTGDETECVTTAENADDESSESTEPTLDDDEMAYLTSANDAAASAGQETIADFADDVVEFAEIVGDEPEAETTAEIADDESSESTEHTLGDDEMAYLTSANDAAVSAEQEAISESADAVAESTEVAGASSDVTDDDLDDLIDVPILPLPAESTEVTDDDLAFIRAPILSPGDPVSIPSIPVQADPAVPPAELSSPSIEEIVQEQEAIESLGNLTAPKVTDPLALFKKLRDLAEELPHNVYYAFKASRMCATLDEIIADFEA